jgi:hypothetical protein
MESGMAALIAPISECVRQLARRPNRFGANCTGACIGRLSEAQAAVMHHLEAAGHGYLCSSDYRDVIETLKGWGILRGGFTVQ